MNKKDFIEDNLEELDISCARCGTCLQVCPVYKELLVETFSPRGRYELVEHLLKNDQKPSKRLKESLQMCLQCGACSFICPSGIKVDLLIRRGRQLIGTNPAQGTIFNMLVHKKVPDILSKIGGKFPDAAGIAIKLSSLFGSKDIDSDIVDRWARAFPRPAKISALKESEKHFFKNKKEDSKKRPTVAFFLGCVQNYLYPEIIRAIREILEPHVNLIIPQEQYCCGLAAYSSGFVDAAQRLVEANLKTFLEIEPDYIVTGCASCAYFLSNFWHELIPYEPLNDRAKGLSKKVYEFSSLLVKLDMLNITDELSLTQNKKVVYHAPCHQRFHLGGVDDPTWLLRSIRGVELIDVIDECCGQGGVFGFKYPDISLNIFSKTLKRLKSSGAELLITNCSGCLLQWRLGISAFLPYKPINVFHPAQLMLLCKR